jgi:hypothetical protein
MSEKTRNVAGLQLPESGARALEASLAASTSPEALKVSKGVLVLLKVIGIILWLVLAAIVLGLLFSNSDYYSLQTRAGAAAVALAMLGIPLALATWAGRAIIRANRRIIDAIEQTQQ